MSSRQADQILIERAKRDVELAAFLGTHGWTTHHNDTARWRLLSGPDDQRILVHRAASGDWLWRDAHDRAVGGSIYHAARRLLGLDHGRVMAAIRAAVVTPPPPLPAGRGGRSTVTTAKQNPTRALYPLGKSGRAYLSETRRIDPATLNAFAHALGENKHGSSVAPHNKAGDGEERGEHWTSHFHGGQDDGPGRGRSLWIAVPENGTTPRELMVAESFIDALSAWELAPDDVRTRSGVASTGGAISEAGKNKLLLALTRMKEQHKGLTTVRLVDLTDVGERATAARTDFLRDLAERAGVEYRRITPSHENTKDWNEELVATKAIAQAAQEAVKAAESRAAYLPPPDEPEAFEEEQHGPIH